MATNGGRAAALLCACALLLAGCDNDMVSQPRLKPLERSELFPDGRSARHPVPGTVPRGHLELDEGFHTGKAGGKPVEAFPFPVNRKALERGRERFDIYCAVCHDRAGTGKGMVVLRGFPPPPSLHEERLRKAEAGHLVDVIASGFGAMPSYRASIPAADRWAIAAYIRALQLSQNARPEDVPEPRRGELRGARP